MLKLLSLFLIAAVAFSQACSNMPADNVFYLTDFCGPATTACGKHCGNCEWAYAADSQRFGCGAVINCVRNGKSMNLEVIDYGPACFVERNAGKPVIDASVSACQFFTGSKSCGWSDHIAVTCKKISSPSTANLMAKGPCTWDLQSASEQVPYCHIASLSGEYNFDNIEGYLSYEPFFAVE